MMSETSIACEDGTIKAADKAPWILRLYAATDPGTDDKHEPSDGTKRAAAHNVLSGKPYAGDEREAKKELIIHQKSTAG